MNLKDFEKSLLRHISLTVFDEKQSTLNTIKIY
jgi:hypothetical protein